MAAAPSSVAHINAFDFAALMQSQKRLCVQLKKELPPVLLPAPVTVPAWTIKMLHFKKKDGKQGTCGYIARLSFGKPGNGSRRKFCNKNKEARVACPGTCKGWCYYQPPFSTVPSEDD